MKKYKKELGKSAQKEGNEKSPKCDVTIVTCRIERVKLESTPKYVHMCVCTNGNAQFHECLTLGALTSSLFFIKSSLQFYRWCTRNGNAQFHVVHQSLYC
jgi:hypothetical protein